MRKADVLVGGGVAIAGASVVAGFAGAIPAFVAVGAALAAGLGVIATGSMAPSIGLFGPAICRGPSSPAVALTFDDGPDPDSTARLCDALDAHGARATFFFLVDRARQRPDLVARAARTHEIALHGPSHDAWLTFQSASEAARRLSQAREELAELARAPVRWYRPPFGATSPALGAAVPRAGLALVWCSIRTFDGVRVDPVVLRRRCERIGPGDIALLHDRTVTAGVLPNVLADLAARGLRPVSVGELLA